MRIILIMKKKFKYRAAHTCKYLNILNEVGAFSLKLIYITSMLNLQLNQSK